MPFPIEEIHIESIEETYKRLTKWIGKHPETMLMPTFSPEPLTPKTYKLYDKLVWSFANPIGLHVHICNDLDCSAMPLPSYELQYQLIKNGLESLRDIGVQTIDFTSGHWSYDEDTFRVCKELGLKNVHIKLKEIPPITFEHGFPKGIRLMPVPSHLHDYDI